MIFYFALCIVCVLCTAFDNSQDFNIHHVDDVNVGNKRLPTARTPLGFVVGTIYTTGNITAEAFLGIPYAQPPIGKLRFQNTRPISGWTGTLNANATSYTCVQPGRNDTNEDCLTLNVIRPLNTYESSKLPVLVWIHGGSFQFGSGNDFDTIVQRFIPRGIILVSINYRLGPFGFYLYGNQGLYDPLEALNVVHKIIDPLGGNRNRVTLWGQSSGASSVSYLSLNPRANHLFSQVITMSGVSQNSFANTLHGVKNTSIQLANYLGCEAPDNRCLQQKSTAQILDAINNVVPAIVPDDTLYISFNPKKSPKWLQAGSFKQAIANSPKRPQLYGFAYQEAGTSTVVLEDSPALYFPITPEKAENYSAADLNKVIDHLILNGENYSVSASKEIQEYYDIAQPDANYAHNFYVQKLAQLLSDLFFNIGSLREATTRVQFGNKNVYAYQYAYFVRDNSTSFVDGPSHADDLIELIYGYTNETKLQNDFIDFLASFIKTGKPSTNYLTAKPLSQAHGKIPFTRVDTPKFTNEPDLWSGRLNFWNKITQKYGVDWPMGHRYRGF